MKKEFPEPVSPVHAKGTSKKMKSPWNFDAPHYDERSSCYVNAGDHHGVGKTQPVGHSGGPKQTVACLPMKSKQVRTLRDDGTEKRNLPLDLNL